ncbi:MAG: ThuA domain-containing protein [Bryobacteraceae bacterium]
MSYRFSVLFLLAGVACAQAPSTEAARALETLGWRVAVSGSPAEHVRVLDAWPAGAMQYAPLFDSLQKSGVTTVVADLPDAVSLDRIEKLAGDYGLDVAIRGADPKAVLAAIEKRGKRIGACGDLDLWTRSGIKPLDAIHVLQGRLIAVQLHDAGGAALEEFIREAYRLDLKPLWIFAPGSIQTRALFNKTIIPIADYHRNYGSRTAGIHRLAGPSAEELRLIEAAIPVTAPATPRKPRKLLVVDLNVGKLGHPSIPYANIAVRRMGEKTGAYQAVFSPDGALLEPDKITQFDAVYLNNTHGDIFDTPAKREAFRKFIAQGGGLVANHATTVASTDWTEFGEILGARGASHHGTDEKVTIKLDDPTSPLNAVYGGQEFVYADEIFRFDPPNPRAKVHVLLSIDVPKTDMKQGYCYGTCDHPDNDYPIAWIHRYGQGRVYYTCLGHNPYTFWNAQFLRQFLAAIQFALGDLDADASAGGATPQSR